MNIVKGPWSDNKPNPKDLGDLNFDFEGYFAQFGQNKIVPMEEVDLYAVRLMGMFCRNVLNGTGDFGSIPTWLAVELAERLREVLRGAPWNSSLPTPFLPFPGPNDPSRKIPPDMRAEIIYHTVQAGLQEGQTVSELLADAAISWSLSHDSVKKSYYDHKKYLDKLPDKD